MSEAILAPLGASLHAAGGCRFLVWAPKAQRVELELVAPRQRTVAMRAIERGYHTALVEDAAAGTRYFYRLDGGSPRPDPASRFQPQGVHGPSEVIEVPEDSFRPSADHAAAEGDWAGVPLHDYILYELHVGTFTPEGTFDACIGQLDRLVELGITAVELMPIGQFPGTRNWGYDGAFPFAVQDSYGGPDALHRLVRACHQRRLAVVLDVVYNHLGPEGNYLAEFGPYFTDRYHTPWGGAINFDQAHSDEVRRYFIENARYWIRHFGFDALRLDAVHAIYDMSAQPLLRELAGAVRAEGERLGRRVYTIAESDCNDVRHVLPAEQGGYGHDAQWSDDLHHALHALLTGERDGYYADFGAVSHLAKAYREGFVYSGQYSPHRKRRHGSSSLCVPPWRLVVCAQNHDQIGNRMRGERLAALVDFERLKLAAAVVLLSPCVPLLFMGEEYGELAPFMYFVSHTDEELVEAVRRGRQQEFAAFNWNEEVPDPQAAATFEQCRIDASRRLDGRHAVLWRWYRRLIELRKSVPSLAELTRDHLAVEADDLRRTLVVRRGIDGRQTCAVYCFSTEPVRLAFPLPPGGWRKLLDSADAAWDGPGSRLPDAIDSRGEATLDLLPDSMVLYESDPRD